MDDWELQTQRSERCYISSSAEVGIHAVLAKAARVRWDTILDKTAQLITDRT
jgi:hypothetical protein